MQPLVGELEHLIEDAVENCVVIVVKKPLTQIGEKTLRVATEIRLVHFWNLTNTSIPQNAALMIEMPTTVANTLPTTNHPAIKHPRNALLLLLCRDDFT
jgi:hypothetical protein